MKDGRAGLGSGRGCLGGEQWGGGDGPPRPRLLHQGARGLQGQHFCWSCVTTT